MNSDIYTMYEKEDKKKNGGKYRFMYKREGIAVNKYGAFLNDKKRRKRSNG